MSEFERKAENIYVLSSSHFDPSQTSGRRRLGLIGCPFSLVALSQGARLEAPMKHSSEGSMRRRKFITLLGSAVALPFAAHAQQRSMPLVGFLGYDRGAPAVAALNQGLRELGYTEGRNIRIEYRWTEGKPSGSPLLQPNWLRSRSMSS
jgi:hypothetical protein